MNDDYLQNQGPARGQHAEYDGLIPGLLHAEHNTSLSGHAARNTGLPGLQHAAFFKDKPRSQNGDHRLEETKIHFERHDGLMWSQNALHSGVIPGIQTVRYDLRLVPGNLNSSYSLDITETQNRGYGAVWGGQTRGRCGVTPGDQNGWHNVGMSEIQNTGYALTETGSKITEYGQSPWESPNREHCADTPCSQNVGCNLPMLVIQNTGCELGTVENQIGGREQSRWRHQNRGYCGISSESHGSGYCGNLQGNQSHGYDRAPPSRNHFNRTGGSDEKSLYGQIVRIPQARKAKGFGRTSKETSFRGQSGGPPGSSSTGYGRSTTVSPSTGYGRSATVIPSTGYGGSTTGSPFTGYGRSAAGSPSKHKVDLQQEVLSQNLVDRIQEVIAQDIVDLQQEVLSQNLVDLQQEILAQDMVDLQQEVLPYNMMDLQQEVLPQDVASQCQDVQEQETMTYNQEAELQSGKRSVDDEDDSKEDRDDRNIETCTLSLTGRQIDRLAEKGNNQALAKIQRNTGADIHIDYNSSPVEGRTTVTIRGPSFQNVHAAVKAILKRTGAKGKRMQEKNSAGGGRVKVYLHAVTDSQADLLCKLREREGERGRKRDDEYTAAVTYPNSCGGNLPVFQEIKQKTGADVQFDLDPSPVQGMEIIIIRGLPSQIEKAVKEITKKTGNETTITSQAQTFWLQWVQEAFPDLESRAYFLPPVHFNHVPMTSQSVAGQEVLVLQSAPGQSNLVAVASQSTVAHAYTSQTVNSHDVLVLKTSEQPSPPNNQPIVPCGGTQSSTVPPVRVQNSDVRDDAAMQRVLFCLKKMCEQNREVLVGMSNLKFGQYLGEPCYAAAAAQLPRLDNLPPDLPQNWKQGDFDVLLIHRHYGIVVCEVKAFGDNVKALGMSQQDISQQICKKLREGTESLNKAEAVLSHLVSDVAPGLRITKTIALPNLTGRQVQEAVSRDVQLAHDLCRCLGTPDPADITGLCLCSDQLSDPKTPRDVSSDVLRELGNWWQRSVAVSGPDSHMSVTVYRTLVARFCGPATTVTVPCTSPPRLCVKTLGQAVSWTGECYTAQITLFPEQVDLINTASPRLFLAGPPGTGKTVVLLLMAKEWLRCGDNVHIVSTWYGSRAACRMLYHLLLQIVTKELTAVASPGQLQLVEYDLSPAENVDMAVKDLSQAARGGSPYVLADEAMHTSRSGPVFQTFCEKLLEQVPGLYLWAASYFHADTPRGWQVQHLTRPLRSPPVVVREVAQDELMNDRLERLEHLERLEQERLEREHMEQKRLEVERLERERVELECQKCEHLKRLERLERLKRVECLEGLERLERLELEDMKHLERERVERLERLERLELEDMERLERERVERLERLKRLERLERLKRGVRGYSERGVPDPTDGPSVKRIDHRRHDNSVSVYDCTVCGRKLAKFLNSLQTSVPESHVTASGMSAPPCLQWRDMLVLGQTYFFRVDSPLKRALEEAGIPVRVMKDDDIEDVATGCSDVVWLTEGDRVRGLERKVVVCLESDQSRLDNMSRCTSQLVVVSGNSLKGGVK